MCFIINDLLTKELIRRDFKFLEPKVKDDDELDHAGDEGGSDDEKDRVISKTTN